MCLVALIFFLFIISMKQFDHYVFKICHVSWICDSVVFIKCEEF